MATPNCRRGLLWSCLMVMALALAGFYSTAVDNNRNDGRGSPDADSWAGTRGGLFRTGGSAAGAGASLPSSSVLHIADATPPSSSSLHHNSSSVLLHKGAADPEVVWIMSFGGSGTSYTLTNVEHVTATTTATNYARDISPNVPVRPDWTEGPFLHKPRRTVPPLILTKTHCGGYCMDCGYDDYALNDADFEQACRTGTQLGGAAVTYQEPRAPRITKAAHLLRDPFDNLVGRAHLASQHREERGESPFEHSPLGFADWCRYLDAKYARENRGAAHAQFVLDLDLPCHAEWYRYVQWHNRAVQVTSRFEQVHHLYYEDYSSDYDATLRGLLDFVHLPAVREPLPFMSGKTYREYFSPEDRQRAAQYARRMASPEAWTLLARYFDDPQ